MKYLITVCLLILGLSIMCYSQINRVRIAHGIIEDIGDLPDDFLDFCHDSRVNYVLAHGAYIGCQVEQAIGLVTAPMI